MFQMFTPAWGGTAAEALAAFRFVRLDGSGNFVYCDTEHENVVGLTADACSSGGNPSLAAWGFSGLLDASGAISKGDLLMVGANGVVVSASAKRRGWVVGRAFAAASGSKVNAFTFAPYYRDLDAVGQVDITTAGAGTYTAANWQVGYIERDCAGAGRTDTTDTAANLIAGLGLDADGKSASLAVKNVSDAAEAITFAGGTGVTLRSVEDTGAQGELSILKLIRTSSTTCDLWITSIAVA